MNEQLREVVTLVFDKEGLLLLEQRLDEGPFKDRWTFTGGKIEDIDRQAEDYVFAAAVREASEEVGLTPEEITVFSEFVATTLNGNTYYYHAVSIDKFSGEIENREQGRRNIAWVGDGVEADILLGGDGVNTRVLEAYRAFKKQESQ